MKWNDLSKELKQILQYIKITKGKIVKNLGDEIKMEGFVNVFHATEKLFEEISVCAATKEFQALFKAEVTNKKMMIQSNEYKPPLITIEEALQICSEHELALKFKKIESKNQVLLKNVDGKVFEGADFCTAVSTFAEECINNV